MYLWNPKHPKNDPSIGNGGLICGRNMKSEKNKNPAPRKRKKPFDLPEWLKNLDKMRCEYCNMVHLGMDCPSKPKQKQPKKSNKRQE